MTPQDKANQLMRSTPTGLIVMSLLQLEAAVKQPITEAADIEHRSAQRRTRLWLIDELERRYDVALAMATWADDLSDDKPCYVDALIAALPAEALS
jgi:hypothetical protein